MNFSKLVPHIKLMLVKHHKLYRCLCKAELWEEICFNALSRCDMISDWSPDYNHVSGRDQILPNGLMISNKSGKFYGKRLLLNGYRTTKWKTIEEKLDYISENHEDYIFCLSTNKKDDILKYYFIVVDSSILDFNKHDWVTTFNKKTGKKTGWEMKSSLYTARIVKSMSDQLWVSILPAGFKEFHEIIL